jgi:hypothetical protein
MVILYVLLGLLAILLFIGVVAFATGALQEAFGEDTGVYFIRYKDFRYHVDKEVKLLDYVFKVPIGVYGNVYGYSTKEDADRAIETYKLSKVTREWKIDKTGKEE